LLHTLDIIAKVVFVFFFFGLCIFIHELGHLLVALWRKLYVERFSVGFGKKLWGTTIHGVEYIVSALPFGGYVALPQLDPTDEPKTSDGTVLPSGPPLSRALTAVAGPVANVLFGFFLGLFIWWLGSYEPAPAHDCLVLGVPAVAPLYQDGLTNKDEILEVNGAESSSPFLEEVVKTLPATEEPITLAVRRRGEQGIREITYTPVPNPEYLAGLRPGDRIVAVDGEGFNRGAKQMLEQIVLATDEVVLGVLRDGEEETIRYNPLGNPLAEGLGYPFFEIKVPVAFGAIQPGSPAERAGLKRGDILLEIDGDEVENAGFFIDRVTASKGQPMRLKVEREGKIIEFADLRAEEMEIDGETDFRIGAGLDEPMVLTHPNPWEQFVDVFQRTKRTLGSLFAPIVQRRSLVRPRHMSGPVGIIQMIFYKVFTDGYRGGLSFIILVTYSLAFFNLLPLPVLDGGHIVYAFIEIVFRRKIPTRVVHWLQTAFAVLLISFMAYVTFYDVRRSPRFLRFFFPQKSEAVEQPPAAAPPEAAAAEEN
jgi:regulator of sigma E protease